MDGYLSGGKLEVIKRMRITEFDGEEAKVKAKVFKSEDGSDWFSYLELSFEDGSIDLHFNHPDQIVELAEKIIKAAKEAEVVEK